LFILFFCQKNCQLLLNKSNTCTRFFFQTLLLQPLEVALVRTNNKGILGFASDTLEEKLVRYILHTQFYRLVRYWKGLQTIQFSCQTFLFYIIVSDFEMSSWRTFIAYIIDTLFYNCSVVCIDSSNNYLNKAKL